MQRIMLMLRTPPPFGGGEILQDAMREHYSACSDYSILVVSSTKRGKDNQGNLALWKCCEFCATFWRVLRILVWRRPKLLFFAIGKGFPHFVRDSMFVWMARLCRVPVAAEVHGAGFYFLDGSSLCRWYARAVLRRLVSLRVLGVSIKHQLARHGIRNVIAIDNGVSVPIEHVKESVDQRRREFRFLFVGTIGPHKGFDLIIDACVTLRAQFADFCVHCAGEWLSREYEECVRKRLDEIGLSDRFVFHGLMHGDCKWSIFRVCDALILPSYNEGQPLVILEALYFGLPVIASTVGAIPDSIEDGTNGILIGPGRADTLREAMLRIAQDERLYAQIAETNRRLFSVRYSLQTFLKRHEEWLQSCIANAGLKVGRAAPNKQS